MVGIGDRTARVLVQIANRGKWLFMLMIIDFVGCSAAYGYIEKKGPIESGWWAIVTGFTVGYGDQYPQTTPGRGVGAFLIVSMAVLWLIASAYITARVVIDTNEFSHDEQERLEASQVRQEIANGTLPPCATELPPLSWDPTKDHVNCPCQWVPHPVWNVRNTIQDRKSSYKR